MDRISPICLQESVPASQEDLYLQKQSPLGSLPAEIMYIIFSYLKGNELATISQVCKLFKILTEDEILWRVAFKRDFTFHSRKRHLFTVYWTPRERYKNCFLIERNES